MKDKLVRVALIMVLGLGLLPVCIQAQEMPAAEADQQQYASVRIKVWSKRYRSIEEHGYGLQGELKVSTSVFRFRTLDEFLDPEIDVIGSVGLRPEVGFEFPTPIRNLYFTLALEAAINEAFATGNQVFSGALYTGLTHRRRGDPDDIETRIQLKYGTDYEFDGLNFDDYVELDLRVYFQRLKLFDTRQRRYTIRPYVETSRFVDDVEFKPDDDAVFDIDTTHELGFAFGVDPRFRVWGIKLPEIRIGYAFGGDFKGIRIRL